MSEFTNPPIEESPVETIASDGLTTIVIRGGFSASACDNHAAAPALNLAWERRASGESVEDFRHCVESEAAAAGAKIVIFGGFPNCSRALEQQAIGAPNE